MRICPGACDAVRPGEDGEVHARGEMLAGGGDDDDARLRVAVDVVDDPGEVDPGLRSEGVEFGATAHDDVGDPVLDRHIEAGGLDGHAFLPVTRALDRAKLEMFDAEGHSGLLSLGKLGRGEVRCVSGWPRPAWLWRRGSRRTRPRRTGTRSRPTSCIRSCRGTVPAFPRLT